MRQPPMLTVRKGKPKTLLSKHRRYVSSGWLSKSPPDSCDIIGTDRWRLDVHRRPNTDSLMDC